MGKKNRLKKKPRTRDGAVFSSLHPSRIEVVSALRKSEGTSPFRTPNHKAWKRIIRLDFEKRKQVMGALDPAVTLSDVSSMYQIGRGRYHSIYVESLAVRDFLENSQPKQSDGEIIRQASKDVHEQAGNEGIAVHLPDRKESIFLTCVSEFLGVDPFDGDGRDLIAYVRGEDVGFTPINSDGSWSVVDNGEAGIAENWRIIFNLFMYMNAFPECVKDGPPDLIAGAPDGGIQTHVRSNEKISGIYEQSKKTPHMRRGHFRVLKSERFTNKRFQAVFVKPTMVGSTASTVTEP